MINKISIQKRVIIIGYTVFIIVSLLNDFSFGKQTAHNFMLFSYDLIKILPCAFVLLGLFEVWVKRQTIEKHFGIQCGLRGYIFAILIAGTTVGGIYVAFPFAHAMYRKGAKLSIVFTYLGAAAICRIPMTLFEISFVGLKFTVIRLAVSLPLVIISSILLEKYLATSLSGKLKWH